jgi:hypothetical protein
MGDAKAMWAQWLTLVGSAVGLSPPADEQDGTLKKYYDTVRLMTHSDKQPPTLAQQQKDRLVYFFKLISNVHETYTDNPEGMRPPDPAAFDSGEEPIDHEEDTVPPPSSTARAGRRVYLVTFSFSEIEGRRRPSEFSRREFGELLVTAFESSIPSLRVAYCAVFMEQHAAADKSGARNPHYHVSIKSNKQHSWAPIADLLRREHRVYAHFAVTGKGYRSAFSYGWFPTPRKPMSELDKDFELINGTEEHPTPSDASKRQFWHSKKRSSSSDQREGGSSSFPKEEEQDHEEESKNGQNAKRSVREAVRAKAYRLIKENNFQTGDEFLAYVQRLDDPRLISLFMSNSADGIVERALHALDAEKRLKRSKQTREEILCEEAGKPCLCEAREAWKLAAVELLHFQKISPVQFARSVMDALREGAAKATNVYIHGTTTSGKSWILEPLSVIFRCHLTPPNKSGFPLQDLCAKELILWQDFRLNEDVLPWSSLLLIFEGTVITVRRPRTEFQGDKDVKVSQPVFISSVEPLSHPHSKEREMMEGRFKFFHFTKTLPSGQVRKVPPCPSCFASFVIAFSTPPQSVPQLSFGSQRDAGGGYFEASQGSSSGHSEFPRTSSSASSSYGSSTEKGVSNGPYCEDCGTLLSSKKFCKATGKPHV